MLGIVNYVGFRVIECISEIVLGKKTKITSFLKKRALVRKMVRRDLKMQIEINHGNSKALAPSKKNNK